MSKTLHLGSEPEDFCVEEIPEYPLDHSGQHIFLNIQKRKMSTDAAVKHCAQSLGIHRKFISCAGRKDVHAITTQWISIDSAALKNKNVHDDDLRTIINNEKIEVLSVDRHRHKLRMGHLRGNRFSLGIHASDLSVLKSAINCIKNNALRNAFGPQRFGRNNANVIAAQHILTENYHAAKNILLADIDDKKCPSLLKPLWRLREKDSKSAFEKSGKELRYFLSSALQSAVFNRVLEQREAHGFAQILLADDLIIRGRHYFSPRAHERSCSDLQDNWQVSGPMPGTTMPQPGAKLLAMERAWSADIAHWDTLNNHEYLSSPGERRPLYIAFLEPIRIEVIKRADLAPFRLHFALPAGSYATQLLKECGITGRKTPQ